jgi:hypothetical protein
MKTRAACALSIALIVAAGLAGAADRVVLVDYFTSWT